MLQEVRVLPVAEAADGLAVRGIARFAFWQHDTSGPEEITDAVVAGLAVHVLAIVAVDVERPEPPVGPRGGFGQILIEQPFPGCGVDGCGVGHDAVHVEDDRFQIFKANGRRRAQAGARACYQVAPGICMRTSSLPKRLAGARTRSELFACCFLCPIAERATTSRARRRAG